MRNCNVLSDCSDYKHYNPNINSNELHTLIQALRTFNISSINDQ